MRIFFTLHRMFNFTRHSTHRLRLWLIASAAILLVSTLLEAGHAHGVVTEADDHCILCQHSVALDKTLTTSANFIAPILLAVIALIFNARATCSPSFHFAPIRAPPVTLHCR